MEPASTPLLAVEPHTPAEQPYQLQADRKAQTGASVNPGQRSVGLNEGLKNPLLLVFRDADSGVGNAEYQRPFPRLNTCRDSTLDGELYRIAHQIDQDLPQPVRVGPYRFRNL